MPRIPQYEEQVGLKATEVTARENAGSARAFGNALGNFGNAVTDFGIQFKRQQDQQRREQERLRQQAEEKEAHAWSQEQESILQRDNHVRFSEMQKQVPEDGTGFNKIFMDNYNTDISNRVKSAPSQRAAEIFQGRATQLGDNYFSQSYNWETKAKESFTSRALERAGENRVQAALQGSNPFDLNAQTDTDYEANVQILGPEAASRIRDQTKRGISMAALIREVQENPQAFLNRSSRFTGISGRNDLQADTAQIIDGIAKQESGNRHTNKDGSIVTSKAGAQGAMQLMPETGKELAEANGEVYDPFDEEQNRRLGAQYFEQLSSKYNDVRLALAAYNAGPRRVDNALKNAGPGAGWSDIIGSLPKETQTYVPSVLRKSGVKDAPQEGADPMRARSEAISDGLLSNISINDIMQLTNRAEGDVKARERQAAIDANRVRLEELAQHKEVMAQKTNQLTIAVSRGEVSYKEVNEAHSDGLITHEKHTELTLKLDDQNKKQDEKLVSWERVGKALSGQGGVIDPGNAEDKKAVDSFYLERVVPQLAEMAPEIRVANQAEYVRIMGVMPQGMQGQIRATLRTGNPEQIAETANLINQVQATKPEALGSLSKDDLVLGVGVSDLMGIGVPPNEAVKRMKERLDPDNRQVTEMRQSGYNKLLGGKERPNFESLAKDAIGGDLVKEVGGYEKVLSDFETSYKDAYLRTGDKDQAAKIAQADIKRTWGVSEITGSGKVMQYPPDKYYAISGAPQEWLTEQLVSDVNEVVSPTYGDRKIAGYESSGSGRAIPKFEYEKIKVSKENIFLIADSQTSREAAQGKPQYQVLYKDNDGVLQPVMKEGRPVRWRPDAKRSEVIAKWQSKTNDDQLQAVEIAKKSRKAEAEIQDDPKYIIARPKGGVY